MEVASSAASPTSSNQDSLSPILRVCKTSYLLYLLADRQVLGSLVCQQHLGELYLTFDLFLVSLYGSWTSSVCGSMGLQ